MLSPLHRWYVGPAALPALSPCPTINAINFAAEQKRQHKAKVKHARYAKQREQREAQAVQQKEAKMPGRVRIPKFDRKWASAEEEQEFDTLMGIRQLGDPAISAESIPSPKPWEHASDPVVFETRLAKSKENRDALRMLRQKRLIQRDQRSRALEAGKIDGRTATPDAIAQRLSEIERAAGPRSVQPGGVVEPGLADEMGGVNLYTPIQSPSPKPAQKTDGKANGTKNWRNSQRQAAQGTAADRRAEAAEFKEALRTKYGFDPDQIDAAIAGGLK